MNISVIVPTYNEEDLIEQCLDSLLGQSRAPDEIIVVDNNSKDDTVEIVKKYDDVTLLHEEQQGAAYAQFTGFRHASGDILTRTDADARFPEDYIAHVEKYFQDNPDIGAVTGPIHFYDMKMAEVQSKLHQYYYFELFKSITGVYPMIGNNMAMRSSSWAAVKDMPLIDNKDGHEDMYLSMLLKKKGIHIGFDTDMVAHVSGRTFKRTHAYWEYPLKSLKTLYKGYKV